MSGSRRWTVDDFDAFCGSAQQYVRAADLQQAADDFGDALSHVQACVDVEGHTPEETAQALREALATLDELGSEVLHAEYRLRELLEGIQPHLARGAA